VDDGDLRVLICWGNYEIFPESHAPPGGTGPIARHQRSIIQLCVVVREIKGLRLSAVICFRMVNHGGIGSRMSELNT